MKNALLILFLIASSKAHVQKNIDGLIRAEKNFAALSVERGTRTAFLEFLDSNGVVFEHGKAVNGLETWQKKELRPGQLNWFPEYAEIALSNDFGYTTGPWELRRTAGDSVIARGHYTTIWHLTQKGEWKFLADLGVANTPRYLELGTNKIKAKKIPGPPVQEEFLNAEQRFIDIAAQNKQLAYNTFLSKQSIINRNGLFYPAVRRKSRRERIRNTPAHIRYEVGGSGIAPSGDLAFVYGDTQINQTKENYIRIWRKEKEGWKIALEVLRY